MSCSSSMIIKVYRLFFCSGKPTRIVWSCWPRGQARNSTKTKNKKIVLKSDILVVARTSNIDFTRPKELPRSHCCLIQWLTGVRLRSNVADVPARHSSERSEQKEEELVTQNWNSKRFDSSVRKWQMENRWQRTNQRERSKKKKEQKNREQINERNTVLRWGRKLKSQQSVP